VTLTGEVAIDGFRVKVKGFQDEFSVDRIGIDTPSFLSLMALSNPQDLMMAGSSALPKSFGVFIEGIRMPVDSDYAHLLHEERLAELGVDDAETPANECTGKYGLSPDALRAMGYNDYNVSASATFRERGNDYAVEISSDSEDMWSVDGEVVIVGNLSTALMGGGGSRAKMRGMRFEYTDLSLNDRIRKYCAELGLSEDEIQAAMLDSFEFMGLENGVQFDEYVMEPFVEFLNGKQTFILTAEPNEPVNLSQLELYNPKDVPALLQLTAEVR
jgi:hypothetical protein